MFAREYSCSKEKLERRQNMRYRIYRKQLNKGTFIYLKVGEMEVCKQ